MNKRTISSYEIKPISGKQVIEFPKGSEILYVKPRNNALCIYANTNVKEKKIDRYYFECFEKDDLEIPDDSYSLLGTVELFDNLTINVFYKKM